MIGIYKITNPTNKIYIGQSIDIENRFSKYSYLNCKKQIRLYNSFKKYGFDKHKFEIVLECSIDELNNNERYYQDLYSVIGKNGLNCTLTKSNDKSGLLSKETKIKISQNNSKFWKEKKRSKETKDKISKNLTGTKLSEETKKKISINSSKYWLGKSLSKNHIEKLRISKIGKKSNSCKILIDLQTGVFYNSIREASILYNIKETTLIMQLKGINKNKTNLRYA
jgi:group I intron endonuclease